MTHTTRYPNINVPLVGHDGNAYSILCRARRAMKAEGLSADTMREFHDAATGGDYNRLLRTVMEWFDTTSEHDDEE